jgi:hypothetical protein
VNQREAEDKDAGDGDGVDGGWRVWWRWLVERGMQSMGRTMMLLSDSLDEI